MRGTRRAPAGKTYAPCPACGEADGARPKDGICYECKSKLELFEEWKATLDEDKDHVEFFMPTYQLIGYIDSTKHNHHTSSMSDSEKKLKKIIEFVGTNPSRYGIRVNEATYSTWKEASHEGDNRLKKIIDPKGVHSWKYYPVVIPRKLADLIIDLVETWREELDQIRTRAFQNGRNLISAMAEGSLSIDEINEATLQEGSKGQ